MDIPSAADLVRVWELGRDRPSWFRGLLLLAPAFPGRTFDDLAAMTIGQRNICLLRLRERLFGPRLSAVVHCPDCGKPSEFSASIDDLCPHEVPLAEALGAREFPVAIAGTTLQCRCPTSADLAVLGDPAEDDILSAAMLARCIARGPDTPALSDAMLETVRDAAYEQDAQLQLMFGIDCAECGTPWGAPFDCVGFLWTELGHAATRLLDDVHVLATAYGWREADILTMSAVRRGFYLERATR